MPRPRPFLRIIAFVAIGLTLLYLWSSRLDTKSSVVSNETAGNKAVQGAGAASEKLAITLEDIIPVDPSAPFDAKIAYHNIINEKPYSPVVIFSKSYCPHSMKAKHILTDLYKLSPAPRVVELDLHPNGAELQSYIAGVTGRRTVPNVVVLKQSYGGGDDMQALHTSNTLVENFEKWAQGALQVTKN